MDDNELDDLFRRNDNYLSDEPPRGFDKDAFWQQLQSTLPKKKEAKRRPLVWWWAAAASVLLAALVGGLWWQRSAETMAGKEIVGKETAESAARRLSFSEAPGTVEAGVSTKIEPPPGGPVRGSQLRKSTLDRVAEKGTGPKYLPPDSRRLADEARPALNEREPAPSPEVPAPEPQPVPTEVAGQAVEQPPKVPIPDIAKLPERVASTPPAGAPKYRVVHINELRQQKRQETRTRSRVALRIGAPAGPKKAEPSATRRETLLSIPLQN